MSPIPVHADTWLAQVVMRPLEPSTNSFVNTWYFSQDDPTDTDAQVADLIRDALDLFYDDNVGSPAGRITPFMSEIIDRTTVEYRIYDLGQAAPRTPIIRTPSPQWQPAASGTEPMPNECAIVLSYRSGPGGAGGGTLDRRARGRVYLGPWGHTAVFHTLGNEDAAVSPTLLERIRDGAQLLTEFAGDVSWLQYSRVNDDFNAVEGGFVDNAFDTQRRRGGAASTRLVFDTP